MRLRSFWLFVSCIILFILYLSVVNIASIMIYENQDINNDYSKNGDGYINIKFSDKVDAISIKEKWYGTIVKRGSSNYSELDVLYLFNFISIPLRVNENSWVWYHLIVLALIISIIVFYIKVYK